MSVEGFGGDTPSTPGSSDPHVPGQLFCQVLAPFQLKQLNLVFDALSMALPPAMHCYVRLATVEMSINNHRRLTKSFASCTRQR